MNQVSSRRIAVEQQGTEVLVILKQASSKEARKIFEHLLMLLESGKEFRIVLKAGEKM